MSTMYHDFMDDIVSFHMELDSLSDSQVGTKADKPAVRSRSDRREKRDSPAQTLSLLLYSSSLLNSTKYGLSESWIIVDISCNISELHH